MRMYLFIRTGKDRTQSVARVCDSSLLSISLRPACREKEREGGESVCTRSENARLSVYFYEFIGRGF